MATDAVQFDAAQRCEQSPMSEPCDGVALAAAGRVHHQIVVPRTFLPSPPPDLSNRIKLVIAREDHVLFANLLAADLGLDHFQVNESGQKVEQAVQLSDLLPQVSRLVLADLCWRVAGAHPVSLITTLSSTLWTKHWPRKLGFDRVRRPAGSRHRHGTFGHSDIPTRRSKRGLATTPELVCFQGSNIRFVLVSSVKVLGHC